MLVRVIRENGALEFKTDLGLSELQDRFLNGTSEFIEIPWTMPAGPSSAYVVRAGLVSFSFMPESALASSLH